MGALITGIENCSPPPAAQAALRRSGPGRARSGGEGRLRADVLGPPARRPGPSGMHRDQRLRPPRRPGRHRGLGEIGRRDAIGAPRKAYEHFAPPTRRRRRAATDRALALTRLAEGC
ncbi:hypothetical protein ACRAWF_33310 [Streptomyces sp. L7]